MAIVWFQPVSLDECGNVMNVVYLLYSRYESSVFCIPMAILQAQGYMSSVPVTNTFTTEMETTVPPNKRSSHIQKLKHLTVIE